MIGRELNLSKTRAYQLVLDGLALLQIELKDSVSQLLLLELLRLDAIIQAHWPRREYPKNAEVLLKVCDKRAHLLGLYESGAKEIGALQKQDEPAYDLSMLTNEELETMS